MLKKEDGQGLVEFALIFVFVMFLVLGIAEVGIALHRQLVIVNAVREGARFAAFGATPQDTITSTHNALSQLFPFDGEIVAVEVKLSDCDIEKWSVYPEGSVPAHVTAEDIIGECLSPTCHRNKRQCPGCYPPLDGQGKSECLDECCQEFIAGYQDDVRLVVVDAIHNHETVLGLFPGGIRIGSWAAMHLHSLPSSEKVCCIAPLGLSADIAQDVIWERQNKNGDGVARDVPITLLLWGDGSMSDRCGVPGDLVNVCGRIGTDKVEPSGAYLRIPVWEEALPSGGCETGAMYRISGFAIVQIVEVKQDTVSFKVVRMDEGCPS